MTRMPPQSPESLSSEAKAAYDAISSGPRGGVRGPFPAWLRSPELAMRGQHLGEFLRYRTSLSRALNEMAIIMTARAWTAQYEWFAHARLAREAGLSEDIIQAIAERQRPDPMSAEETALYDFCMALHDGAKVSDAVWSKAVETFGENGVVEIIGLTGYYVMVAMTLNATEVALPEGEPTPLAE